MEKKRKAESIECDNDSNEKKRKTHVKNSNEEDTQGDDIIHLNVGGWKFSTTLNTLRAEQGSMLEKMFSGDFPLKREQDGTIFIDRNGKLFEHILDYLRGNMASIDDLLFDDNTRKRLIKEASYYQLEGMENILSYKTNSVEVKDDCKEEIIEIIEKVINNKQAIQEALRQKEQDVQAQNCERVPLQLKDLSLETYTFENHEEGVFEERYRTVNSVEMTKKSFDFEEFSYIDFQHDVCFRNCSFYKAKFVACDFSGTVDFNDCDLVETEFSDINFDGDHQASFDRSDLRGTKFTGIQNLSKKIRSGQISFNKVKYGGCAIFSDGGAKREFINKISN